jgi:hypothetical protein
MIGNHNQGTVVGGGEIFFAFDCDVKKDKAQQAAQPVDQ